MSPAPPIEQRIRGKSGGRAFVMIDGFNLGLEKGTGVATYARNLSYGLRGLASLVEDSGGRLEVVSRPGKGTVVSMEVESR